MAPRRAAIGQREALAEASRPRSFFLCPLYIVLLHRTLVHLFNFHTS